MPPTQKSSLGPLIALYRYRPLGRAEWLTLIAPGTVAVLSPLFYGLYRSRYAYAQFGPAAAYAWAQPWYLVSLAALLVFAIACFARLRQSQHFIAVHKHGVYFSLSRSQRLTWNQISGVAAHTVHHHFLGVSLGDSYRGVIFPTVGKPIPLAGGIANLPELLSRLKARLYPRLLPELRSRWLAGEWLFFGPLAVQRQALRLYRRGRKSPHTFPWSQVNRLDVHDGQLVVEFFDRPRLKLPVYTIPNIEILLQLVRLGVTV
ncbi:MAG: hypothetical protein L0Z70_02085 [Chloroflexi bacterium]|nr:hypothetical protein [Chloroflexota bacterium]